MVDKTTVRVIVYATIGVLGIAAVVAVVALSTRGQLQADLDAKLLTLQEKKRLLETRKRETHEATQRQKEAEKELRKARELAQSSSEEKVAAEKRVKEIALEKQRLEEEASKLRERHHLVRNREQGRAEESLEEYRERLSKMSTAKLQQQMGEEFEEFQKERADLEQERLAKSDQTDLKEELEKADALAKQYDVVKRATKEAEVNETMEDAKQSALERLEEIGEQNEVFLEDLSRDAKRNTEHLWKEGTRPGRMQKLARQMDNRAEVLRQRRNEDELRRRAKSIRNVEAEPHKDERFAAKVKGIGEQAVSQEGRVERDLRLGEDDAALQRAKALEAYAKELQMQALELERVNKAREQPLTPEQKAAINSVIMKTVYAELTPAERKEHAETLTMLENELMGVEAEAMSIEKGLQRRALRQSAVDMSTDANRLSGSAAEKLRHGNKSYADVEDALKTEGDLLQAMKEKNIKAEQALARKLQLQDQVLEEDAARLANEVDASEFGTLEEKASAKAIASRLREEAKRMEQISMGVESDEFQREIRDASHNVDAAAEKVVENKGFEQIKGKVEQVHDDARVLNTAVGKGDLEEEQLAAKKVQDDIDTLEKAAESMEKEIASNPKLTADEHREYVEAIKEMKGHADTLKKYAMHMAAVSMEKAGAQLEHLKHIEATNSLGETVRVAPLPPFLLAILEREMAKVPAFDATHPEAANNLTLKEVRDYVLGVIDAELAKTNLTAEIRHTREMQRELVKQGRFTDAEKLDH